MATNYRGTRRERRALDAFIKLMRASDSVRQRLEPTITKYGITAPQFGVLETIWHLGPMNHATLADKRLVTRGNITSAVDILERDGLVRRKKDKDDRRQSIESLTPKRRHLVSRIFPDQLAAIMDDLAVLTATEQELLSSICRKLGRQGND